MALRITELMIGDYARVNRDGLCIREGSIVVIRGIDADRKLEEKGLVGAAHCHPLDEEQFDGGIWCDYLDAIHLTPEILKKNGFSFTGSGQYEMMLATPFGISGDRYNIYVGLKKKTIDVFVAFANTESKAGWRKHNSTLLEVSGPYVHELRHALRLCGINKQIEL